MSFNGIHRLRPNIVREDEDSGASEPTYAIAYATPVNAPRMWSCGHCGSTSADSDERAQVVTKCRACGGPRPLAPSTDSLLRAKFKR